jgi:hypothetical protein
MGSAQRAALGAGSPQVLDVQGGKIRVVMTERNGRLRIYRDGALLPFVGSLTQQMLVRIAFHQPSLAERRESLLVRLRQRIRDVRPRPTTDELPWQCERIPKSSVLCSSRNRPTGPKIIQSSATKTEALRSSCRFTCQSFSPVGGFRDNRTRTGGLQNFVHSFPTIPRALKQLNGVTRH